MCFFFTVVTLLLCDIDNMLILCDYIKTVSFFCSPSLLSLVFVGFVFFPVFVFFQNLIVIWLHIVCLCCMFMIMKYYVSHNDGGV